MRNLLIYFISLLFIQQVLGQTFNDIDYTSKYSTYFSDILQQDSYYLLSGQQTSPFTIWYNPNTLNREIYIKVNNNGVILDTITFDTIGYNDIINFTLRKGDYYYSIGATHLLNDTSHIVVIKRDTDFNVIGKYIYTGGWPHSKILNINTSYFVRDSLLFLTGVYYSYQGHYANKSFVASFNLKTMQMDFFKALNQDYAIVNLQCDSLSGYYRAVGFDGKVYSYNSNFNLISIDSLIIQAPASSFSLRNNISYLGYYDSLSLYCGSNVSVFYSNYPTAMYSIFSLAVLVVDSDFNALNHFIWYYDTLNTQVIPAYKHCLIRSSDSGYFVGGITATLDAIPIGVFVVKVDSDFNTLWQKHIDYDSLPNVSDMIATDDGGVLVLYSYINTESSKTVKGSKLIKIGPNGEVTNITDLNINRKKAIVNIYPNPVSESLTVSIIKKEQNIEEISIYDMQFKEIERLSIRSLEVRIDISTYTKGIYLLEGKTNKGEVFVKKFIVE